MITECIIFTVSSAISEEASHSNIFNG